jgi:hypothetical protein
MKYVQLQSTQLEIIMAFTWATPQLATSARLVGSIKPSGQSSFHGTQPPGSSTQLGPNQWVAYVESAENTQSETLSSSLLQLSVQSTATYSYLRMYVNKNAFEQQ